MAGGLIGSSGTSWRAPGWLTVTGALLIGAGLLWGIYFPINKPIWTSSYVLFAGGIGMIILALLYVIIDIWNFRGWTGFFNTFGTNALFTYLLAGIWTKTMLAVKIGEVSLYNWIFTHICSPMFEQQKLASLLFAIIQVMIVWAFGYILYRKKIIINSEMDIRTRVEKAFGRWKGSPPEVITRLPQSGSDRVYFRLICREDQVIGAYNPSREENEAFVGFSNHFRSKGLPVPEIYVYYPDEKIYFLEDLGDINLFTWLARRTDEERFNEETEALFLTIAGDLVRIQTEGIRGLDLSLCYPHRSFDRQSIVWDMNYYKYMFLKLIGAPFNETRLERDFEILTRFLLDAGQEYFLFRDFQTANIMILDGKPWYIDYQGGRLGAPQYDIASLAYDAKALFPARSGRRPLTATSISLPQPPERQGNRSNSTRGLSPSSG
jgi:hypothetical protein